MILLSSFLCEDKLISKNSGDVNVLSIYSISLKIPKKIRIIITDKTPYCCSFNIWIFKVWSFTNNIFLVLWFWWNFKIWKMILNTRQNNKISPLLDFCCYPYFIVYFRWSITHWILVSGDLMWLWRINL